MKDYQELVRKWKDSGMTGCGSPEEFMLRAQAGGMPAGVDDVMYLVREGLYNTGFGAVVANLVSGTDFFDKALSGLAFYIDYYVKSVSNCPVDQMKYGRSPVLDMCMSMRPDGSGRTAAELMNALADKVDKLFEGRLEHVRYFRAWLGRRGKAPAR